MIDVIHRNSCPVCGSAQLKTVFSVKDHTVSGRFFEIAECQNCTLRVTQDIPGVTHIGTYYQSDDYISHTDTSKGIINRIYKVVRKAAQRHKSNLLEKHTRQKNGTVLDIGSGTGFFLSGMRTAGWQVTGLEPSQSAREFALKQHNLGLKDISELDNLRSGYFDAVTLWHVLEHVHDLQDYFLRFKQVLKNTGRLFVAVPNYTCFDAKVYKSSWAAYDVPRHLYHFSPVSMKKLLEENGFEIIRIYPMWFDSFYVSLLSSKYKWGKTYWLQAFFTAFISNVKALFNKERCSSIIYVAAKKN